MSAVEGKQSYVHVLQVLTFKNKRISRITMFVSPQYFANFGMAAELEPS